MGIARQLMSDFSGSRALRRDRLQGHFAKSGERFSKEKATILAGGHLIFGKYGKSTLPQHPEKRVRSAE